MNASKVCLYSEVIHSIPDDQRSAPVNICADRTGSLHAHSSSINAESLPLRSSSVRLKRRYRAPSAEHRAALLRNRMATAASIGSQSVKIVVEQARSKTAQSLALPCPSNVVRACLAGTKYNVGKLKIQLHDYSIYRNTIMCISSTENLIYQGILAWKHLSINMVA